MDIPEKMDQGSSLANKRKRGRPRRDESQALQPLNVTTIDENLIGQVVSGVVEGSFEAGYFLSVKVADTEKQLKGVVFLPERVTPVTPTTDLFPHAKMYARKNIPVPSLNQQTPPWGKKDVGSQTDDTDSEPQTENLIAVRNQSATLPDNHPMSNEGSGSVAIVKRNDPMDIQVKDVGCSSAEGKLTEPEGQTLSLMPQFDSGDAPKEDNIVLTSKACAASKTAVTVSAISPKDSTAEVTTTLLDFFPGLEASREQDTGSSSMLSLELFQNGTKQSETEEEKSLADAEHCGRDLMVEEKPASPIDDVPEELQLELGNKKMSALATETEANPDQSATTKSGFVVNLHEGRAEREKEPDEPNAASASGFPEVTQSENNNS